MGKFLNHLEQAERKMGRSRAFSDFLIFAVCCLSAQEQEELYLKTAKSYDKKEMELFSHAFAELVLEMDNNGTGLKDCLGDYFMECCYNKDSGQFFTPEHLCDMITLMINPDTSKPIHDPCCGSGRFFLSAAKTNRNAVFYGADIDIRCCQMTLINMCLNGLFGVVAHMNTLSLEEWHRWEVKLHPKYFIPYIHEIDLNAEKEQEINIVEKLTEIEQPPPPKEETPIYKNIKDKKLIELFQKIESL